MIFCCLLIFSNLTFSKNSIRNTIRVLNSLDPDQDLHTAEPDLGKNCYQRSMLAGKELIQTFRSFNPYPTTIFCPENVVCFLCLLHIFKCNCILDFFMEVNNMNPDQTAPQSDLDRFYLQCRLPKT